MSEERRYWLDDPKNRKRVFWILCGVCLVLAGIDPLIHRHAHYRWEGWPLFYAAFGFVAFWCIVIAGKHLRKLLKRDEDYYD